MALVGSRRERGGADDSYSRSTFHTPLALVANGHYQIRRCSHRVFGVCFSSVFSCFFSLGVCLVCVCALCVCGACLRYALVFASFSPTLFVPPYLSLSLTVSRSLSLSGSLARALSLSLSLTLSGPLEAEYDTLDAHTSLAPWHSRRVTLDSMRAARVDSRSSAHDSRCVGAP
jgi:hypothetical protein